LNRQVRVLKKIGGFTDGDLLPGATTWMNPKTAAYFAELGMVEYVENPEEKATTKMNEQQQILIQRLNEAGVSLKRFLKVGSNKLIPTPKHPEGEYLDKAAFEDDFPNHLYGAEDLDTFPRWGIMGSPPLVLLDFDKQEIYDIISKVLPDTFEVTSPRHGLPHRYYVVHGGQVPNNKFHVEGDVDEKGHKNPCGEIRSNNHYLVAPGTTIRYQDLKTGAWTSGEYKITNNVPLAQLEFDEFMELIKPYLLDKPHEKVLTADKLEKGVSAGERHDTIFRYACRLVGDNPEGGWPASVALDILRRYNQTKLADPVEDEFCVRVINEGCEYAAKETGFSKEQIAKYGFKGIWQQHIPKEKIIFSTPPRGEYSFSVDDTKPMSLDDVEEVLNTTLKRDHENKLMVFLTMLMNYSGDDQQNILFNAPSSTGKSYIALEIAKLFPSENVDKKGYTSPTAFFHVMGKLCRLTGEPLEDRNAYIDSKLKEWEKDHPRPSTEDYENKSAEAIKRRHALSEWKTHRKAEYYRVKEEWDGIEKIYVVSLEKRILIFKDQPHDRVLQVLRSMLSHDEKVLEVDITDKTKEGGHRTKKIRVIGYPTVVFCSASFSLNEQERTRFWILSPDMSQDKLKDSLKLQVKRLRDKEKFETELNVNEKRALLIRRIQAIKASNIHQIIIPESLADDLLTWFTEGRDLSARDQRDFPRLIDLVKAHALFQMFQRTRTSDNCSVIASQEDVDVAKKLLDNVLKANRLGLPPYVYKFFFESLKPSITSAGMDRESFSRLYYAQFKERLGEKARKLLIDLLKDAGLIEEAPDPADKRKMKIYIPLEGVENKKSFSEDTTQEKQKCERCGKPTTHVITREDGVHCFCDVCLKKWEGNL